MKAPATLPVDLDALETALLSRLLELRPQRGSGTLDPLVAAELFEAQAGSRIVDHTARWLRAEHEIGYYTIGSAGHESNAAVAWALRPTDPALLHYRSGGFYFARAAQFDDHDPVGDVLRGMLARTSEPIAGGRHKVFGHHRLNIVPQTSTISSQLPRAVGLALSFGHASHPQTTRWPRDSVVVCSFGDASLNHSTAQGALNWAARAAYDGVRVPILFVCEDNGLGISVPTPADWVEESTRYRNLVWAQADGHDPAVVLGTTTELVDTIRTSGRPGFLHLRTVRYLGHAGTDVESAYRSGAEMRADLEHDPLLGTAAHLVAAGGCSGADLVDWFLSERAATRQRALSLLDEPELGSAAEVTAPLAPVEPGSRVRVRAQHIVSMAAAETAGPVTVAQAINATLAAVLSSDAEALVFGEDVGRKGGVYGVTRGLYKRFGRRQVFDTVLDEQTILGLALGAGINGFLPIPEIQYLAYLHNAEDQLRGEAATLSFFSQGQFRNPLVVRVAAYAYQRGFGGHFHNDNSVAVLRDIPGVVLASPSSPADAAAMLATCVARAEIDGSVCVFLEPIARYHTSDLWSEGDQCWLEHLPGDPVDVGRAATIGDGHDGTILTWGNGRYLSQRAVRRLEVDHGRRWRVVDLRWLAPLPVDDIVREAEATGRVLVVDETRRSGGVGEAVLSALVERGFEGRMDRVAGTDSFVPLGAAARHVLVSEDQIVDAAVG